MIYSYISGSAATRVISNNPIQTEDSFVANVTIRGIGNATDTGTFVTTHKPSGITTSEGQGIISAADGEIATYTAKDLGFTTEKGDTVGFRYLTQIQPVKWPLWII